MSNPAAPGPAFAPPPPLPAGSAEMLPAPPSGVTVRMYRQGLGDCFLLAFPTATPGQAYYVLIDCGVLQGAPNATANLQTVARDIKAATGGQIHLLIATHRHADHVSGFQLANDVFAGMTIHNLWLSWAENPDDPLAKSLWKQSGQALAVLARAVQAQPQALANVAGVLDFVGDLAAAGGDPMEPVRSLLKQGAAPVYREPGEGPLALPPAPGVELTAGVRIYILAPPRDLRALGQMDPAAGSNETYLATGVPSALRSYMLAGLDPKLNDLDEDERAARERSFPFLGMLRIPPQEARTSPFFRKHYGFDDIPPSVPPPRASARTIIDGPAWRRVDADWLASSEELALQLDNCINNTSLVMAIELPESGRVLLFVADAQVGNWLSWADLPDFQTPGAAQKVAVRDLLQRTVLYKVGHHGSHNATGRALAGNAPWGLELMTSPDLVAMLPVDEAFANEVKHWPMPWPDLTTVLTARTHGRIMRLDRDTLQATQAGPQWDSFAAQVQTTPLYIQYTVSG